MEEIFTAEFLVHEVSSSLPYIAKPAITIRFLEFPTLTVFGSVQKTIIFNKGKSCKFSMTLSCLRESLRRYPLYIMLVDAFPNNIKMMGSAAVDLSGFADSGIPLSPDFKRNTLNLHDPVKNIVARVDLSISISQYTDGIVRTPGEVFEKINHEAIKVTPPELQSDKSIGTDPVPAKIPGKLMKTSETMTVCENDSKEIQTSVFNEFYNPPPMFFTKTKTYTKPAYYPTVPPEYQKAEPQVSHLNPTYNSDPSELLIDKLIKEIQYLKQVSSLQQHLSYPPVMSFDQPTAKPAALKKDLQATAGFYESASSNEKSKSSQEKDSKSSHKSTKRSIPLSSKRSSHRKSEKESNEDYSEDFEEESYVKSSSRDGFTKCFLCGEFVRNSEAREHPGNCRKIRDKYQSPRPGSSGTWGKDVMKSVTSIAEEYESDFEKVSSSLSRD